MILKVFPSAGFADADLPAISKSTGQPRSSNTSTADWLLALLYFSSDWESSIKKKFVLTKSKTTALLKLSSSNARPKSAFSPIHSAVPI